MINKQFKVQFQDATAYKNVLTSEDTILLTSPDRSDNYKMTYQRPTHTFQTIHKIKFYKFGKELQHM